MPGSAAGRSRTCPAADAQPCEESPTVISPNPDRVETINMTRLGLCNSLIMTPTILRLLTFTAVQGALGYLTPSPNLRRMRTTSATLPVRTGGPQVPTPLVTK